jgi:peptide-methionine (R)-S-oxide reductase
MVQRVERSDSQWREVLTPEQHAVMRGKGTEPPFSGLYWDAKQDGLYRCAGCGAALFASTTKYDSGTGWPSFWEPVSPDAVRTEEDHELGMRRIEALCATCDAHLGHVFPDGPQPTGERWCINSLSLEFNESETDGRDESQA